MVAIRMQWTARRERLEREEKERRDAIRMQSLRDWAEHRARHAARTPLSQKSTTDRYGTSGKACAPTGAERPPEIYLNDDQREESALGGLFGGMALALVLVIATLYFVRWWLK